MEKHFKKIFNTVFIFINDDSCFLCTGMLNWYIADYTFNCTIDFTLIFILDCTLLKIIPSKMGSRTERNKDKWGGRV